MCLSYKSTDSLSRFQVFLSHGCDLTDPSLVCSDLIIFEDNHTCGSRVVVFVVCMDGSYKGVFVLFQKECPSVQCFVCPDHGMDGFLKNVGSSEESIRIQDNVMGISRIFSNVMDISSISSDSQMEWNEPFFGDCFDDSGKLDLLAEGENRFNF
jgi:hypothetical protein